MRNRFINPILMAGLLLQILFLSGCDLFLSLNINENSSFSSSSSNSTSSSSSSSGTGGLIFWSKLDSSADVTAPAIGLAGTVSYNHFAAGKYGNAYMAGYGYDYQVQFPKAIIPANKGCIEFWAKLEGVNSSDAPGATLYLFAIEYGYEQNYKIQFAGNDGLGGGGLSFEAGSHGDYASTSSGTYGSILGDVAAWHHYAAVWDINTIGSTGKKVLLYLDGSLMPLSFYRDPADLIAPSSTTSNAAVNLVKVSGTGTGINILIDNLKIYNYAKTDFSDRFIGSGLIAYYPFNGNAHDESGGGNNGSLTGSGVSLGTDRFGNASSCYQFDGSASDIEAMDNANVYTGIPAVTISCWVYPSRSDYLSCEMPIVAKQPMSSMANHGGLFELRLHNGLPYFGSEFHSWGGTECVYPTNATPISLNTWSHLAVTYNTNTQEIRFYINGSMVQSYTTEWLLLQWNNTAEPFRIGSRKDNYGWWTGKLDDIRIYNTLLSDSDIQALYHEGGW